MKYNWPAVVSELRKILVSNVVFKCDSDLKQRDFSDSFAIEVRSTDRFHPWDTDGELCRALENMPAYCNYRNIKSYWAWKDGKEFIADALYSVFDEQEQRVREHYEDAWNFAPGYKKPLDIEFKVTPEQLADLSINRIIKAAKIA